MRTGSISYFVALTSSLCQSLVCVLRKPCAGTREMLRGIRYEVRTGVRLSLCTSSLRLPQPCASKREKLRCMCAVRVRIGVHLSLSPRLSSLLHSSLRSRNRAQVRVKCYEVHGTEVGPECLSHLSPRPSVFPAAVWQVRGRLRRYAVRGRVTRREGRQHPGGDGVDLKCLQHGRANVDYQQWSQLRLMIVMRH